MTVLLNSSDLARLLDWESVCEAVGAGFMEFSQGRVDQPQRSVQRPSAMPGTCLVMPCAVPRLRIIGTKLASIFPGNPSRGLPTISAVYALLDFETGECKALMDGAYLTAFRTAAASVVATQAMARSDAKTVAIFGTGTQAAFHAQAFAALIPSLSISVCGSSPEKSRQFRDQLAKADIPVECAGVAQAAACDVIVTATSSTRPLFDGTLVRDGTHINSVGSHAPRIRELDTAVVTRSRVFADSLECVFAEAGDILLPIEEGAINRDHVLGELGDVLCGTKTGRVDASDITLFKSNGVAFQDAVTADIAFRRAGASAGPGRMVTSFAFTQ